MTPYYQDDAVTIYHGDALEAPPLSADLLLIDPPYSRAGAVNTARTKTSGRSSDSAGSDQFWLYWFTDVAKILTQRIKPTGCGYVFTDYRTIALVERAVANAGTDWAVTQGLVWDRQAMGLGSPWRAAHELIAFCRGPEFQWAGRKDMRNVIPFRWPYGEHTNHPAEKPVGLLQLLIEESTRPGDLIFDAFTGSGSALVAAKNAGRRAIAIEAEERYCEIAARRCSQQVLGLDADAHAIYEGITKPLLDSMIGTDEEPAA